MSVSLFGLHLMTEDEWTREVAEREALRHHRDELARSLAALIAEGRTLNEKMTAVRVQTNAEIRKAIETVLGCNMRLRGDNIRLTHRADQAEAEAEQLREQLVEALRRP